VRRDILLASILVSVGKDQRQIVMYSCGSNPCGLRSLQIQFPSFSIWLSMIGSNSSTFLMRELLSG